MLAACNYLVIIIEHLDDLLYGNLLSLCKENKTIVCLYDCMSPKKIVKKRVKYKWAQVHKNKRYY